MADMKTKNETKLFQNLKMVDELLQKTKLSLTEIIPSSNDIFDKVIGFKQTVSEIIDIVVESLVRQNDNKEGFKEKDFKHVQSKEKDKDIIDQDEPG